MTYKTLRGLCVTAMLAIALSGCAILPRGAAVEREILTASTASADAPAEFMVLPVTRDALADLSSWPTTNPAEAAWIPNSGGPRTQVIAPGDRLEITIWDSNESSLISAPTQRAVRIEALTVAPNGSVFVPYVGDTNVAGMTLPVARETLQKDIDRVVPSAQVQLTIVEGRGNSVDLVAGVAQPGPFAMPDRNFTLLNLIAAGGGVQNSLSNPQVRLIRDGRIYGMSVARLYEDPALDTRLVGGDRVIIEADRRYFLSLGAAGRQSQHGFTQDDLSALDAISIIGGVESRRGNPGGVLVLREYPDSILSDDQPGPDHPRVVFSLDLTSADGLFSARNFHLAHGDLVLVTESPITSAQTIFGLIGSVFGLARQSNSLTN